MATYVNAQGLYGRGMDQVAVGRRLAAARKRAGIKTRNDLADRVNLPRLGKETLGKIERGERALYEHEAPYVARALEVPVGYFYEDETTDTQLDRIEATLAHASSERAAIALLVETQNENLTRQTQILEAIGQLLREQSELLEIIRALIGVDGGEVTLQDRLVQMLRDAQAKAGPGPRRRSVPQDRS